MRIDDATDAYLDLKVLAMSLGIWAGSLGIIAIFGIAMRIAH